MIQRFLPALFLLLLSFITFAATPDASTSTPSNQFNSATANKLLNKLNTNNILNHNNAQELKNTITSLTQLNIQAKRCVTEASAALADVSKSLEPVATPTPGRTTTLTPDQKYLNQKKADLSEQLSDCRLFIMRSEESINELSVKLRSVVKTQLLYEDTDVLKNISQLPTDLNSFYKVYNFPLLTQLSGITILTPLLATIFFSCLLISILASIKLRSLMRRAISNTLTENFATHLKQAALSVLHRYIVFLIL